MGSSKDDISLLKAYKGLHRTEFLSLYHTMRVAAGGELPTSDWAASQLFPSLSRNRTSWKADHYSELSDIAETIASAIKNGQISAYTRENADAVPVVINTREFINKTLDFMPCLEDIKSDGVIHSNVHFKTDEVLSIFSKKKSSFANSAGSPAVGNRKPSGKPPVKKEAVIRAMIQALKNGLSIKILSNQSQESLKADYNCGRETACKARKEVLQKYPQE
jgi:hypothetical protein